MVLHLATTLVHGVWNLQKKSHFTILRATFWFRMQKKIIKSIWRVWNEIFWSIFKQCVVGRYYGLRFLPHGCSRGLCAEKSCNVTQKLPQWNCFSLILIWEQFYSIKGSSSRSIEMTSDADVATTIILICMWMLLYWRFHLLQWMGLG